MKVWNYVLHNETYFRNVFLDFSKLTEDDINFFNTILGSRHLLLDEDDGVSIYLNTDKNTDYKINLQSNRKLDAIIEKSKIEKREIVNKPIIIEKMFIHYQ